MYGRAIVTATTVHSDLYITVERARDEEYIIIVNYISFKFIYIYITDEGSVLLR